MGYYGGFDLYPQVESQDDLEKWKLFLEKIETIYKNDPVFEVRDNDLVFTVGEHPELPKDGKGFKRLSTKFYYTRCMVVIPYVKNIARIARSFFGSRIYEWDEMRFLNGDGVNNSKYKWILNKNKEYELVPIRRIH